MSMFSTFLLFFFLYIPSISHATIFTSDQLSFYAPSQSIWESGGGASSFGAEGTELGIGYDIGASSGTVSVQFQGEFSADYTPYLPSSGITSLGLSFLGSGNGQLTSELGAWANVSFSGVNIIDWGASLNINESFTPQLGNEVLGSDVTTIAKEEIDIGIFKIGAGIGIEQENSFIATDIDGRLAYSLRGSGITNYTPFYNLADSSMILDVLLSDSGKRILCLLFNCSDSNLS